MYPWREASQNGITSLVVFVQNCNSDFMPGYQTLIYPIGNSIALSNQDDSSHKANSKIYDMKMWFCCCCFCAFQKKMYFCITCLKWRHFYARIFQNCKINRIKTILLFSWVIIIKHRFPLGFRFRYQTIQYIDRSERKDNILFLFLFEKQKCVLN